MDKLPSFFLAVDTSNKYQAESSLESLYGIDKDFGIKLNLDLILSDIMVISRIKKRWNRPIFVDLKLWNGRRTMREVVKMVAVIGASVISIHALTADLMVDAVEEAHRNNMCVLANTILTHYDDKYCKVFFGMCLDTVVYKLAREALHRKCDGYILPGTKLNSLKDLGGIKFCPAVRPSWFGDKLVNWQKQIITPSEALKKGADIVSCGSPVFKSKNPSEALEKILEEIDECTRSCDSA